MTFRDLGKNALSTILDVEKNIQILEKNIYEQCIAYCQDEKDLENVYLRSIYQTIGDVLNGTKLKDVLANIKKNKIEWNHSVFHEWRIRLEEQDNFIENPFEVAEGVQQCKAVNPTTGKICNSKRVLYYAIQERGSDEPMTTYNTCCACGAQWKYSG